MCSASKLLCSLLDGPSSPLSRYQLYCAPSPPPAPDYLGAAQAQGQANIDTARANSKLNNPNVISPYGTQTVTYGGFDQAGYDKALKDYNSFVPQYDPVSGRMTNVQPAQPDKSAFTISPDIPTVTQTFSPEQQALYDQSNATKLQLSQLAGTGADALQGVVGTGVDFSNAPKTSDYNTTRQNVIDAYMGRANEDYAKQLDQKQSDMIAAGIRPGSKAYADNMQMTERARNDAYQQAEIAGGNAASQAYGMDSDRRRQAITEYLAQRQTPLNEITALMSGSQVSNPFSTPGYNASGNAQPAPLFGATQAQSQYATDLYNAKVGNQANMQGGLFGLGAAGLMAMSDRRLKSHITRVGTHPLGIGLYVYTINGERQAGVMADEVLKVKPSAVEMLPSGYYCVDYAALYPIAEMANA